MTITNQDFGIFVAILVAIYYIVPKKCQWLVLLGGSIYFYYGFGLPSLGFLIGTIVVTYLAGALVQKVNKSKTIVMFASVAIFLALMIIMRISSFASIIAPMGLSFYAMMCIGYIIDVQRGAATAEKNPLKLALYISYFPHIIEGPFEDYSELSKQFNQPHYFNYDKAVKGAYRIVYGLIKKIVIADRISLGIVDEVYASPGVHHGATVLLTMVLYAIQLYCDFSGYMDIVCGVSEILDIDIRENFNAPFLSKSMAEFWRRWHMSLGLWFKNYVFFPVQRTELCNKLRKSMKKKGNKYGMKVFPSVLGLIPVWTLIGLWHGFDWNYLLYDWFCGLVIIFSELMGPVYDRINGFMPKFSKSKVADALRTVRTFVIVCFSFLIFRPDSLADVGNLFTSIFVKLDIYKMAEFIYWHSYDFFLIVPGIIAVIIVDILKYKEIDVAAKIHSLPVVVRYAGYILVPVYLYLAKSIYVGVSFAYSVF